MISIQRRGAAVVAVVVALTAALFAAAGPTAVADPGGAATPQRAQASAQISAGYGSTCAVVLGTVRCWGGSGFGITSGAVGPITAESAVSIGLPGGVNAQAVSVAREHACALGTDGSVSCWGDTTHGRVDAVSPAASPAPIAGPTTVAIGGAATTVASGWYFTCALRTDGVVRCWGLNGAGNPGPGAGVTTVALPASAVAITAGRQHACAVLSDGSVRCWGQNGDGQLGRGGSADDRVSLPNGSRAVAVSAAYSHSCAVLDTGALYCWGLNANGRLGVAAPAEASAETRAVGDDERADALGPVAVGGAVAAVSAGYDFTCAVLSSGALRCFGNNTEGQLAKASTSATVLAADSSTEFGSGVAAVSTGVYHSCVVTSAAKAVCVGNHTDGRLGYTDGNRRGHVPGFVNDVVPLAADLNIGQITTTPSVAPTTAAPTTAAPTTAAPTTAPLTTAAPPTAAPSTAAPATTAPAATPQPTPAPAPAPAPDTTPPNLRVWVADPTRTGSAPRVCVLLTSNEPTIAAFAVRLPNGALHRSAITGVGADSPTVSCVSMPRTAVPRRGVSVQVVAMGIDAAANWAVDTRQITLRR